MIKISQLILFSSIITTGLIAGLFYSWSVSVTPGLANIADREYVLAFQAMNKAILNPAFFLSFMGTLVLLPLAAWTHHMHGQIKFYLLLGAAFCYWIGVFGVTVAGNVPMNESLDAFRSATASDIEFASARQAFEARWNFLNTIRTLSSIAAFALVVLASMRSNGN